MKKWANLAFELQCVDPVNLILCHGKKSWWIWCVRSNISVMQLVLLLGFARYEVFDKNVERNKKLHETSQRFISQSLVKISQCEKLHS